jgi:hypothetical protein
MSSSKRQRLEITESEAEEAETDDQVSLMFYYILIRKVASKFQKRKTKLTRDQQDILNFISMLLKASN